MAENSGNYPKNDFSIQVPAQTPEDDVESAKILFQEGLLEEAKKILHRVLIARPAFSSAQQLLGKIHQHELGHLLGSHASRTKAKVVIEDPDRVIHELDRDLGLNLQRHEGELDPNRENWIHPPRHSIQDAYDLGVAFFEMGCFRDALHELDSALRKIRVEQSDLGSIGVAIAALCAECLLALDDAFEAKTFLVPILSELELSHEAKLPLFYLMARAEERLSHRVEAKAWLQKVIELDPLYRDTRFRIRLL